MAWSARGREIEEGPAAVVWAASMPGAEVSTHHFEVEQADAGGHAVLGVPDADELGQTMILLADPYSFATEALLDRLDELRPGMPVLGGAALDTPLNAAFDPRGGLRLGEVERLGNLVGDHGGRRHLRGWHGMTFATTCLA